MTNPYRIQRISKVRGEEFNPSKPYEQLSAEKKRRRSAVESTAFGGAATLSGAAGTGAAHAKFAGTRTGQGMLKGAELKYGGRHPLNPHIKNAQKIGQFAARHKNPMTAAVLGGAGLAAGAKVVQRFRENEEIGISQGLGRIKAGTTYRKDQKNIQKRSPLTLAASLVDVNWQNPAIKAGLAGAAKHQKKILLGAGGVTALGAGGAAAKGANTRRVERDKLRRLT